MLNLYAGKLNTVQFNNSRMAEANVLSLSVLVSGWVTHEKIKCKIVLCLRYTKSGLYLKDIDHRNRKLGMLVLDQQF